MKIAQKSGIIRLSETGPTDQGLSAMVLDPADFQSALPEQNIHAYFEDANLGLTVGVWDTTAMQEAFGPYPGDEFIWVIDGQFSMVDGHGNAVSASKGDAVCFRNGAPMSWKQNGYLKKFFITYLDPKAQTPEIENADGAVVVLNADVEMPVVSKVGEPVEREYIGFTNDAGNFSMGTWSCEAAKFDMEPFSMHEFVYVLEGSTTITEEDGTQHEFSAGDCFFIPKGTVCQWHIPTFIKKHFAGLDAE